MRNLKSVLAVLAAMALLAGCGDKKTSDTSSTTETTTAAAETTEAATEATTEEVSDETDYTELSQKLAKDLSEDKIDTTTALFSETVKQQLTDEAMKQVLEQMKTQFGEFKELKDTKKENQMGMNITTTRMVYEKSELDLMIVFNKEGKIDGILFQPAQDEEIVPQETDTYVETAVKVGEHELDGMLNMPKNAEKPPLVILIQGSGQHNMNEGFGETGTFSQLSKGFAERGIATLRYNKRFFQYPELAGDGDFNIDEEVLEDADAAVKLAQSYVDEGKVSGVYVMGHSLGGCVAPVIAKRNSEVKGIISLAGTPRNLIEIVVDQLTAQINDASDDASSSIIKESLDTAKAMLAGDTSGNLLGSPYSYYESLIDLEVGETAKGLDIPMLFLQGKDDIQVYADKDYPLWQEYLDGKDNCTFKLYDGLGHFFTDDNDVFDKQVMDDAAEFINNCAK